VKTIQVLILVIVAPKNKKKIILRGKNNNFEFIFLEKELIELNFTEKSWKSHVRFEDFETWTKNLNK